ncbi:hypothetical protein [Kitasatospora sp. NPDC005856]|uniref:hypothetical protein n=1 Tax=Kitasatospora sp. NPDC005856 TaxID=3154566 RepID=UPI0033E90CC7
MSALDPARRLAELAAERTAADVRTALTRLAEQTARHAAAGTVHPGDARRLAEDAITLAQLATAAESAQTTLTLLPEETTR